MVRAWPLVLVVSVAHASPASDALLSRDAVQIRATFAGSVTNGGLWFADPACRAAFATPGELTGRALDAFATCLAVLPLAPSDRAEPFDDRIAYTYAPGFEVEARLSDDGVRSIGPLVDGPPTITAAALEQLRISGEPELPGASHAWVKLCLDELGRVTSHEVREASSPRVARAADAAVATWDFGPFRVAGRPLAVCALEELHAAQRAETSLPVETTSEHVVITHADLVRIAGDKYLVPDDADKTQLMRKGADRVDPAFEVCIDSDGAPTTLQMVHGSGLATYDQKIEQTILHTWRYRPYTDRGVAVPVCAIVHFVYQQR